MGIMWRADRGGELRNSFSAALKCSGYRGLRQCVPTSDTSVGYARQQQLAHWQLHLAPVRHLHSLQVQGHTVAD